MQSKLPEGLLADSVWMEQNGFSRALRKQWVDSGRLQSPVRGVFWRPRGKLTWEQVVVSLQTILKLPVSLGGETAINRLGFSHYLKHSEATIHLYSDAKLPTWLHKLELNIKFQVHNRTRLFPQVNQPDIPADVYWEDGIETNYGTLMVMPLSKTGWPLTISVQERAIFEYLDLLPKEADFHTLDMTFEGMANLRPKIVQSLLEQCKSIKVKRLFCYFADRHNHTWWKKIDTKKIDLGKGKRVIVNQGTLDAKYQITVPQDI